MSIAIPCVYVSKSHGKNKSSAVVEMAARCCTKLNSENMGVGQFSGKIKGEARVRIMSYIMPKN